MKIAIIPIYTDPHRRGHHHRSILQPQIGPVIAALLPDDVEIEVINDTWRDPDWDKVYDLVFFSCMHSDFDRARHISHYFRQRGALTVLGGNMATTYPDICKPFFDAIAIGDPEDIVPSIFKDAKNGKLEKVYRSAGYDASLIPPPQVERVIDQQVLPASMEISRGCPFTCNFCALTGSGTRFKYPQTQKVLHDLDRMDEALKAQGVPKWKRRIVSFYDNNMAGNMPAFKELCKALIPKKIIWGTCVTFNVMRSPEVLDLMYQAGCRNIFVGIESFNPVALDDFNKKQNRVEHIRDGINNARRAGIHVSAGMMLSPIHDDPKYIRKIPKLMAESGLHVPVFVCMEAAIPGTPLFHRMANTQPPMLLPNAALHDFTGYSLVIRPAKMTPEAFTEEYRWLLKHSFTLRQRTRKVLDDFWWFFRKGSFYGLLTSWLSALTPATPLIKGRTHIPETDPHPPETVPLTAEDFKSREAFEAFMKPTMVTDAKGHILPEWRKSISPLLDQKFDKKINVVEELA